MTGIAAVFYRISIVPARCGIDNIGLAKSIVRNGGLRENEAEEDEHIEKRYWTQS